MQFLDAMQKHAVVKRAVRRDPRRAAALWDTIVLTSDPEDGYTGAVKTMMRGASIPLLTQPSGVAAAYAFEHLWDAWEELLVLPDPPLPSAMRRAANAAWTVFEEKATKAAELSSGFGWGGDGGAALAWTVEKELHIPLKELPRIEAVARLAGRMYAAIKGERANRVQGAPGEVYGIEMGGDLGRLLPLELTKLGHPSFATEVFSRLLQGNCTQYAVRGRAIVQRGPLVVLVDESDSMVNQSDVHDPRTYSKAATVALLRVAFDEKRPTVVVHFSTSIVCRRIEPGDFAGLMAMIRHFLTGGTEIGSALEQGAKEIQALAKQGARGADVVVITDGQDGDDDALRKGIAAVHARDARIHVVAIQTTVPKGTPLRDAASQYVELTKRDIQDETSILPLAGIV